MPAPPQEGQAMRAAVIRNKTIVVEDIRRHAKIMVEPWRS